jgi:hypothetical protein
VLTRAGGHGGPDKAFAMSTVDRSTPTSVRPAVPRSLFIRLVHNSDLPPSTRHVLLAVAWSAQRDGTGSYVSLATVAARTGLGRRRVRQLLTSSRELGWINVQPRPGRVNDWVLSAPAGALHPGTTVPGGGKPSSGGEELGFPRRKDLGRTQEARVRAARLPWCGRCDEETRLTEDDDGRNVRRCPGCHPLADAPPGRLKASSKRREGPAT